MTQTDELIIKEFQTFEEENHSLKLQVDKWAERCKFLQQRVDDLENQIIELNEQRE